MVLTINDLAFFKIAGHAAKFSDKDVCGLLIGTDENIVDVIPLSHLPLNSCFLHMSLDLVILTFQKKNDPTKKIIGFYDFVESFPNDEPNFQLQKSVLSALLLVSKSEKGIYLRGMNTIASAEPENLQEMTVKEAMNEFVKTEAKWDFIPYTFERGNLNKIASEEVQGQLDLQKFEKGFARDAHLELADIDEHLDDPSKDFMNPSLPYFFK